MFALLPLRVFPKAQGTLSKQQSAPPTYLLKLSKRWPPQVTQHYAIKQTFGAPQHPEVSVVSPHHSHYPVTVKAVSVSSLLVNMRKTIGHLKIASPSSKNDTPITPTGYLPPTRAQFKDLVAAQAVNSVGSAAFPPNFSSASISWPQGGGHWHWDSEQGCFVPPTGIG